MLFDLKEKKRDRKEKGKLQSKMVYQPNFGKCSDNNQAIFMNPAMPFVKYILQLGHMHRSLYADGSTSLCNR